MQICRTVADMRACLSGLRRDGACVGLVPTMGALHDGHLSLIALAKTQSDAVVASLFVNPAQFGEPADLDGYPRNEARDLALFEAAGVAAVFAPEASTIYPPGDETIVECRNLANILHGQVRPGHFRGVTTVVARLFNIVAPDVAVFGEKDYQQLQVIRRMVADLHYPIRIMGAPTMREADGLAMSSRNVRLDPADRQAAPVLNRALDAGQALVATGTDVATLRARIIATLATETRSTLEGLDIVHPETLSDLDGPITAPAAVMMSVRFGDILLIDQRVMVP